MSGSLLPGAEFDVGQISNGTPRLRVAQDISESDGALVINVDGYEARQKFVLP
jgi:hypothetical protein